MPAVVQEGAAVLTTVSDRAIGLEKLFVTAAQALSSVSDCEQRLARALDESSFSTVDDAVAALLEPEDEARRLQAAQNHREKRQGA